MKFDDILTTVGEFGHYQRCIYVFFFVLAVPPAFHFISIVFLAGSADHWCAVAQWSSTNCSEWGLSVEECDEAKKYASRPQSNETEIAQCYMYNVTNSPFIPLDDDDENTNWTMPMESAAIDYHSMDIVPCASGWVHDKSLYKSTINTEFSLVCDDEDLADISSSLWFVGVLTGSIIYGYIGDRFGRMKAMWMSITGQLVFGVAVAFAPSFWWFAFLRTFLAINNFGVMLFSFVLGTEFVGTSKRVIAGTGISIGFSFGYIGLATLAYFIRDWRHLQLALSVPGVLFYICIPFIPESVRWLLSVGRVDEATAVINKIAKTNKVALPQPVFSESDVLQMEKERGERRANVFDLFRTPNLRNESFNLLFNWFIPESVRWLLSVGRVDEATAVINKIAKTNKVALPPPVFSESDVLQMEKERGERRANVFDLFRTPNLRNESFNLLFNWFVESFVYYGLALSASDFGVNVYIAAFISGAVEIPAYVTSFFALEYFGRRRSTCFYLVLGGVACILTIVIPAGFGRATMATIGKFGVTASFSIIYIYTVELYPTPLRSIGIGMCSVSSRIGGIIAPLVRISGRTWAPLPFILYGAASIAAGLLALLLPESKGRKLPETVEEGENFRNLSPENKYITVDNKDDEKDVADLDTLNANPHPVV